MHRLTLRWQMLTHVCNSKNDRTSWTHKNVKEINECPFCLFWIAGGSSYWMFSNKDPMKMQDQTWEARMKNPLISHQEHWQGPANTAFAWIFSQLLTDKWFWTNPCFWFVKSLSMASIHTVVLATQVFLWLFSNCFLTVPVDGPNAHFVKPSKCEFLICYSIHPSRNCRLHMIVTFFLRGLFLQAKGF